MIKPKSPTVGDLKVGDSAYIFEARTDEDGNVYVARSTEIHEHARSARPAGKAVRIRREKDGLHVEIPRSHFPIEPMDMTILEVVGVRVADIEIVD